MTERLELFFQGSVCLFWLIFLTALSGSLLTVVWQILRKKSCFGQDMAFMRRLLWPVFCGFLIPVLFWYWLHKEGEGAFTYEMFRSAGVVIVLINCAGILWAAKTIWQASCFIRPIFSLYQMKKRCQYDAQAQKTADGLCVHMGIIRRVFVYRSSEIFSPMTMGFLCPCIFLPVGRIGDNTMELILVHELTHIRHKDFIMKMLMMIISSLYWFCPGVKQLFSDMNACNEYYCDLDSIRTLNIDRREYYDKIRAFAIDRKRKRGCGYSSLCENRNTLKARERAVERTQLAQKKKIRAAIGHIAVVIVSAVITCISVYGISFASVVGYDAVMKFITSEKAERQEKQIQTDVSALIFTGEDINSEKLLAAEVLSETDSDAQKWTLQDGQEIQFGPFYKEKGQSIWVYTYANCKVEYGIIFGTSRRCLEGNNEGHNFEIDQSGMYYVFMRNCTGQKTQGGSLVVQ